MIGGSLYNWIEYYWCKLFRFDTYSSQSKQQVKLENTVYGTFDSVKTFVKVQNRVHRWFKYIFLVPGLHIARLILGKYLVKQVTEQDGVQYQYLRLFDEVFDKTLVDWHIKFLKHIEGYVPNKGYDNGVMDNSSVQQLLIIKQLMLTVCKNDTAYMEFFNMLLFNLVKEGNNTLPEHIKHVLYTSKHVKDIKYFVLKSNIEGNS